MSDHGALYMHDDSRMQRYIEGGCRTSYLIYLAELRGKGRPRQLSLLES